MAIGDWYEQTILKRLWRFPKSAFSSQRFWDHMDRVSEDNISSIEQALLPALQEQFALDSELLLYDTTNFFTFLATTNQRADLPRRGHSKAKRHDLRQMGLALLVTKEFQIPVLHHVYQGNTPDVTLFPQISAQLTARYAQRTNTSPEATLVFDKGNVSEDGMEHLVACGVHFIAALSANRLPEALKAPQEQFDHIPNMPGTQAFSTTLPLWEKSCQVIVSYSESFFTQQLSGITQNMVRTQAKLAALQQRLATWQMKKSAGKRPTLKGV